MKKPILLVCLVIFATISSIQAHTEEKSSAKFILTEKTLETKFITRRYDDINETKRFEIKAEYPEIENTESAGAQTFNQIVKNLVMGKVEEFRKSMLEYTEEDLKTLPKGMSNYIEIGYSVESADERFISVNFGRSEYTGGAHPNSWTFTLNYDLEKNRQIKLSDLFKPASNYLKVISDYSIRSLKKQQGENADSEWITTGAGAEIKNYESWNITKEGLKFLSDFVPLTKGTNSLSH